MVGIEARGMFGGLDFIGTPVFLSALVEMREQLKILFQQLRLSELTEAELSDVMIQFLNKGFAAALAVIEEDSAKESLQVSLEEFFAAIKQVDQNKDDLLAHLRAFEKQLDEFLQGVKIQYGDAQVLETLPELFSLDIGSSAVLAFEQKLERFLEKIEANGSLAQLLDAEDQCQDLQVKTQAMHEELQGLQKQEQVLATKLKALVPVQVAKPTQIEADFAVKIPVPPVHEIAVSAAELPANDVSVTKQASITAVVPIEAAFAAKSSTEKSITDSYAAINTELTRLRAEMQKARQQLTTLEVKREDRLLEFTKTKTALRAELQQEFGQVLSIDLKKDSKQKLAGVLNLLGLVEMEGDASKADAYKNTALVIYHYHAENAYMPRPGQKRVLHREELEQLYRHS